MGGVRSRFELGTSRTKFRIVAACQRARLHCKLRKVSFCQIFQLLSAAILVLFWCPGDIPSIVWKSILTLNENEWHSVIQATLLLVKWHVGFNPEFFYILIRIKFHYCILLTHSGPGSSVGIATELRAGRSGDRILVGERFSAPVQTGPEVQTTSRKMVTGSFPGVRCGWGETLTPHSLLVPR
jgi:hypothetical protein